MAEKLGDWWILLIDWFFWGEVFKKLSYGIEKIPGLAAAIDVRTLLSHTGHLAEN